MKLITISLFCLFSLGVLGILIKRLHLFSLLLCLELLLLSLFLNLNLLIFLHSSFNTLIFSILLLTFSACEARAGLALMVTLSRSHNTDLLTNINLLHI